ncbi:MAG: phosphoribosylpyrophosphate synthetase [Flavobacteriales bacterium]|nr:phosphoribosylpyrophosphate synthetase [Flavobacteriales bacterium]
MPEAISYDTLSQAVNDLQRRGYVDELELAGTHIACRARAIELDPDAFVIDEFHRFEGETDPSDESIVYAISAGSAGIRGILINAYGPYGSEVTQAMVRKLTVHR